MGLLMLLSVFYTGWVSRGQSFSRLGTGVKTVLLTLDILLSVVIVTLATVTGNGSTQMVWGILAVAGVVRMLYIRDHGVAKAGEAAEGKSGEAGTEKE